MRLSRHHERGGTVPGAVVCERQLSGNELQIESFHSRHQESLFSKLGWQSGDAGGSILVSFLEKTARNRIS